MLNYEEFIKYCRNHFPHLKERELASIFNKLSRNELIDLEDLIKYLKDQQKQKEKVEERNRRKEKALTESRIELKDNRTLRSLIAVLLKEKLKTKNTIFHSLDFVKLERLLKTEKGELLRVFKQIDRSPTSPLGRGSFTHNELVNYYIVHHQGKPDLPFAFQIMGNKLEIEGHRPATIVGSYSSNE